MYNLKEIPTDELIQECALRGILLIQDDFWSIKDVMFRRNVEQQTANTWMNDFLDEVYNKNGFFRKGIEKGLYRLEDLGFKGSQKSKFVNRKAFDFYLTYRNMLKDRNLRKCVPDYVK